MSEATLPSAAKFTSGPGIGFVIKFALIFVALEIGYYAIPDPVLLGTLIHNLLVVPSASLINTLDPGIVTPTYNRLVSSQVVMEVIRGCDGTSSAFLLVAAMVAFPAGWAAKLGGVSLGLLCLHAVNVLRVTGLFFLAREDMAWFHTVHGYIAPTLIVLLVCGFFLFWINRIGPARPVTTGG